VESDQILVDRLRWCDTFGRKLRGFTFRRTLAEDDGLVLVEKSESRMKSSIHMLFVFFDLGVLWVDDAGEVVDSRLAKRWRSSYVPDRAARYVVEAHPVILKRVAVGDHIQFLENAT
jgi:uncharacterized membrane protein (UPF0127 family)